MTELKHEYAATLAEKKKCFVDYNEAQKTMKQLSTALANVNSILGKNGKEISTKKSSDER